MDSSTMMRGQSLPASDPTVDQPAQPHVHEEPEEGQNAESSSNSQMRSDPHQSDEVWKEYHPLLTGSH